MNNEIKNIVILGSGNLATHITLAFYKAGVSIIQVYSRNEEHAKELANKVEARFTSKIDEIAKESDLYIFALSDSALATVLQSREWNNAFLVHTSGSIPASIFETFTSQYGVLYPFQTFTKGVSVQMEEVPFFIESNGLLTLNKLEYLVKKISVKINTTNSEVRLKLHLAGVFANNFTNHMLTIASGILKDANIPVEHINPLIEETVRKALEVGPFLAQTGPASRGNIDIVNKHLKLLEAHPDWQKIYTFVSDSISKIHNNG